MKIFERHMASLDRFFADRRQAPFGKGPCFAFVREDSDIRIAPLDHEAFASYIEQMPVRDRLGDVLQESGAVTPGEIDEALKIRNEEELPVYDRLGDVRGRAVTMGKSPTSCKPAGSSTRR